MDKVDAWQVFWTILIFLGTYISVMITIFRKNQKEIETKLDGKVATLDCKYYRDECEKDCERSRAERAKFIHQHGQEGRAGEVIK